ncbi:MAG: ABC-2 transporter permease [Lysinibacillus sp.]
MFNLIWKDLLVQKRQIPVYIVTIGVLFLVGQVSLWWVAFLTSMSFITNAFFYDEKDNINILLNSLPYTRKQIVISKYLGALVFTGLFIGIIMGGGFIINGMELSFSWKDILHTFGLIMVFLSIIFPFFYKFNQQSFMIGAMVFSVVAILAFRIVMENFNEQFEKAFQWIGSLPELQLYAFAAFIILLLYSASWLLSLRIYERKVF